MDTNVRGEVLGMKSRLWVVVSFVLLWFPCAPALAQTPARVRFADGSTAQAQAECGIGDLCGSITFANGDVMSIYNVGVERCAPFQLHVIRKSGDTVVMDNILTTAQRGGGTTYSSNDSGGYTTVNSHKHCARFKNSSFTFDQGLIKMSVFLAKDGDVFVQFTNGK